MDVGLTHHGLLAEVLIVHHLQCEGWRIGLLCGDELQPQEEAEHEGSWEERAAPAPALPQAALPA